MHPTRNWREDHLNYNDVKKWEYRDLLGNLGIFREFTWDFYKITVGNAALGHREEIVQRGNTRQIVSRRYIQSIYYRKLY